MNNKELHYDFKIKIDKIDSFKKRNFETYEIDWIINEAQILFMKQRFGQSNFKLKGFETTNKRKTDLGNIHIKSPVVQPGILATQSGTDIYSVSLDKLKYKHFIITRVHVDGEQNGCEKNMKNIKYATHDDLNEYLIRSFNKPSFKWGRVILTEGQSDTPGIKSLYIYTDDFKINNVYIDYVKMPRRVWFGNYDSLDGQHVIGDKEISLELDESIHSEIIDIAVSECSRIIENPDFINLKSAKLQTNE
jgi:hypothetical protein